MNKYPNKPEPFAALTQVTNYDERRIAFNTHVNDVYNHFSEFGHMQCNNPITGHYILTVTVTFDFDEVFAYMASCSELSLSEFRTMVRVQREWRTAYE